MQNKIVLAAAFAGVCLAIPPKPTPTPGKPLPNPYPACRSVEIDVSVTSSLTKAFPPDFNLGMLPENPADIPGMLESVPFVTTSANYTVAGRFCMPNENVRRNGALQIFVHGNTYTKDYWRGAGEVGQEQYSWEKSARDAGFYTLAVDLPCNGRSSAAHGVTHCQLPLDAEAMKGVIDWARSGMLPIDGIIATKPVSVQYVGHSYGSLVGNFLAALYPQSVDTYLLTGFTNNLMTGGLGALLIPQYSPVGSQGYVKASNKAGVQQLFYDGNYDQSIADLDYSTRGTLALGEVLTSGFGQAKTQFAGPIMIINGNEDEVMCQSDPAGPFNGVKGDCASFSAATKNLYPNAYFTSLNIPSTGHTLNLHQSSQTIFTAAQRFLSNYASGSAM